MRKIQKQSNIIADIRAIIKGTRNLRNNCSFSEDRIWQTHLPNLTWSHYNALLRVLDKDVLKDKWRVSVG